VDEHVAWRHGQVVTEELERVAMDQAVPAVLGHVGPAPAGNRGVVSVVDHPGSTHDEHQSVPPGTFPNSPVAHDAMSELVREVLDQVGYEGPPEEADPSPGPSDQQLGMPPVEDRVADSTVEADTRFEDRADATPLEQLFDDTAERFDDTAERFDDTAEQLFDDTAERFDDVAQRFDDAAQRFDETVEGNAEEADSTEPIESVAPPAQPADGGASYDERSSEEPDVGDSVVATEAPHEGEIGEVVPLQAAAPRETAARGDTRPSFPDLRHGPMEARVSADMRPSGAVTITVIDPDDVIRNVLREHLRTLNVGVVMYDSVTSLVEAPGRREPTVIVLGPSVAPDEVIERVEAILKARPDYGAVMLVFNILDMTGELVRGAFHAGIDDVIAVSADDTELLGAITRSMARVQAHLDSIARPAPVVHEADPASGPAGRVVTVFGTKGGMGKSVVAVNLAVALAKQTTEPVVLVDGSLQFGDVAIMLQLQPEHTITEAVMAGDRLDWHLLEGLFLRHKPSNLLVLAAPPEPATADQIGRSDVSNIIEVLRERCAFVVVDTSPRIDESTLVALQSADDILMLTSLDVMSLKNSKLGLQTLQALGIQLSKVKLVLNRANTQVGLTRNDAERAIEMKVDAALPSESLVVESVNAGVPVVLSAPTSKFALCIDELAHALMSRSAGSRTTRQKQLERASR
jgi:pilus assembly protein CpaE